MTTEQDPKVTTPEGPPDDPGRREEAQDPDREGGVGPPETPPGQAPEATPKAAPEDDDGEAG